MVAGPTFPMASTPPTPTTMCMLLGPGGLLEVVAGHLHPEEVVAEHPEWEGAVGYLHLEEGGGRAPRAAESGVHLHPRGRWWGVFGTRRCGGILRWREAVMVVGHLSQFIRIETKYYAQ